MKWYNLNVVPPGGWEIELEDGTRLKGATFQDLVISLARHRAANQAQTGLEGLEAHRYLCKQYPQHCVESDLPEWVDQVIDNSRRLLTRKAPMLRPEHPKVQDRLKICAGCPMRADLLAGCRGCPGVPFPGSSPARPVYSRRWVCLHAMDLLLVAARQIVPEPLQGPLPEGVRCWRAGVNST